MAPNKTAYLTPVEVADGLQTPEFAAWCVIARVPGYEPSACSGSICVWMLHRGFMLNQRFYYWRRRDAVLQSGDTPGPDGTFFYCPGCRIAICRVFAAKQPQLLRWRGTILSSGKLFSAD
jgi:hypothetical protein